LKGALATVANSGAGSVLQQECEDGMSISPQLPAISRQQALSSALKDDAGKTQAMTEGTRIIATRPNMANFAVSLNIFALSFNIFQYSQLSPSDAMRTRKLHNF